MMDHQRQQPMHRKLTFCSLIQISAVTVVIIVYFIGRFEDISRNTIDNSVLTRIPL